MADTYPSEVETFKVVGRLARGVADSADPGQEPDIIPIANAEIIFTADLNPPIIRVPTAVEPLTIFIESIVATTDSEGYLKVKNETERGVVLPYGLSESIEPTGWTWRVQIKVGGGFPARVFSIAGSPGAEINLSSLVPVPSNPGFSIEPWTSIVNQVTQLRDEAASSRNQIVELTTTGYLAPENFKILAKDSAVEALAEEPTLVDAAEAVVTTALVDANVITGTSKLENEFIIVDSSGYYAIKANADGSVEIPDFHTSYITNEDGSVLQPKPGFVVRDADHYIAFEVTPDGKVYIGDPDFVQQNVSSPNTIELIIGAGQSNSEGRGRPYGPLLDPPHNRLYMSQWVKNLQAGETYATAPYVSDIVPATVPLSSQQTQKGLSIQTVIAREILRRSDDQTRVVILNAAAGGSGLVEENNQGKWAVDYAGTKPRLYQIAKNAIDATLFKLAEKWPGVTIRPWIVWHQGEADGATPQATYEAALDAVISGLRTHLGSASIPVVIGGMVPEYVAGVGAGAQNIRAALAGAQARNSYVAYTDGVTNGGGSETTDDRVHYARAGVERLGVNMHRALNRAVGSTTTATPHKPLDVSATFDGASLSIKWSEPDSRFTNFLVEYSLDGVTWSSAVRVVPTLCEQVVTGLTATGPVRVRISTVNGASTSEATTPITATGV